MPHPPSSMHGGGGRRQSDRSRRRGSPPPNVTDPALYLAIKRKIRAKLRPDQRWGAYHSGMLVTTYKREWQKRHPGQSAGAAYRGPKPAPDTKLKRWYQEKWVDVCAWPTRKPCGRARAADGAPFPFCRPSKRITGSTPKTVQELTPAERQRACRTKRASPRKRMSPLRRRRDSGK